MDVLVGSMHMLVRVTSRGENSLPPSLSLSNLSTYFYLIFVVYKGETSASHDLIQGKNRQSEYRIYLLVSLAGYQKLQGMLLYILPINSSLHTKVRFVITALFIEVFGALLEMQETSAQ